MAESESLARELQSLVDEHGQSMSDAAHLKLCEYALKLHKRLKGKLPDKPAPPESDSDEEELEVEGMSEEDDDDDYVDDEEGEGSEIWGDQYPPEQRRRVANDRSIAELYYPPLLDADWRLSNVSEYQLYQGMRYVMPSPHERMLVDLWLTGDTGVYVSHCGEYVRVGGQPEENVLEGAYSYLKKMRLFAFKPPEIDEAIRPTASGIGHSANYGLLSPPRILHEERISNSESTLKDHVRDLVGGSRLTFDDVLAIAYDDVPLLVVTHDNDPDNKEYLFHQSAWLDLEVLKHRPTVNDGHWRAPPSTKEAARAAGHVGEFRNENGYAVSHYGKVSYIVTRDVVDLAKRVWRCAKKRCSADLEPEPAPVPPAPAPAPAAAPRVMSPAEAHAALRAADAALSEARRTYEASWQRLSAAGNAEAPQQPEPVTD